MSCRDLFRHCTKPCRLCTKSKNFRVRNTFHRISRDLLLNSFFSRLERIIRLVKKGTSTCYGSSEERERWNNIQCTFFPSIKHLLLKINFVKSLSWIYVVLSCSKEIQHSISFTRAQNSFEA